MERPQRKSHCLLQGYGNGFSVPEKYMSKDTIINSATRTECPYEIVSQHLAQKAKSSKNNTVVSQLTCA